MVSLFQADDQFNDVCCHVVLIQLAYKERPLYLRKASYCTQNEDLPEFLVQSIMCNKL